MRVVVVRTCPDVAGGVLAEVGRRWKDREVLVRPALATDGPRLVEVGRAAGSDVDDAIGSYLPLLLAHGAVAVAVAEHDDRTLGYGGLIDLPDGTAMLSDLFVDPDVHGGGVGTAIVTALFERRPRRLTFSSQHPAALAAYARLGMEPRWRLRVMAGVAGGDPGQVRDVAGAAGALPRLVVRAVAADAHRPVPGVPDVLHRPELVAWHHRRGGRTLELVDGSGLVGSAIVVPWHRGGWSIARLVTTADHGLALTAVLDTLPPGAQVRCAVPEWSSASGALDRLGFDEIDVDVCCSTRAEPLPASAAVLHQGLC